MTKKKLFILGAVLLLVIALAIPTVMILTTGDITMAQLTETPGTLSALFQFGIPDNSDDGIWRYRSVTFQGIPVDDLFVGVDAGTYGYMLKTENEESAAQLTAYIKDHCTYQKADTTEFTFSGTHTVEHYCCGTTQIKIAYENGQLYSIEFYP